MSENHHYEYATAAFSLVNASSASEFNSDCRDDAMIQATLALAYEQRTANLIALWLDPNVRNDEGLHGVDYGNVAKQIIERLDLA